MWLVTGAEGFLGNTIVRRLHKQGETVRAGVYGDADPESLHGIDCEKVLIDVTDPDSVRQGFEGAGPDTTVIHCAGVVSIAGQVRPAVEETNVGGTKTIIDACRDHHVRRLVYVSSVHVLPELDGELSEISSFNPDDVVGEYAKTKTAATALVQEASHDLDSVIVQPAGIIGPGDYGDTHLTRLVRDLAEGTLPLVVAGGYNFADVRDIADGTIAAARRGRRGRSYLLTGHQVTLRKLGRLVASVTGRRAPIQIPLWVAKVLAPLAEWISSLRGTAPLFTRYSLHTLNAPANFSHARASRELGYRPRPLKETITDTVKWLTKRYA